MMTAAGEQFTHTLIFAGSAFLAALGTLTYGGRACRALREGRYERRYAWGDAAYPVVLLVIVLSWFFGPPATRSLGDGILVFLAGSLARSAGSPNDRLRRPAE